MRKIIYYLPLALLVFSACSPSARIGKLALRKVVQDSALLAAHVGISIYDPAAGKYLYNFQGDKYFVPASNTKLPTCYAAMKYLGDSLAGLQVEEYRDHFILRGTGDPTLLHPDFSTHPVLDFIRSLDTTRKSLWFGNGEVWNENALGYGWTWSDYDQSYMPERSPLPVYGNVVSFTGKKDSIRVSPSAFHVLTKNNHSIPGGFVNRVDRDPSNNAFTTYTYGKSSGLVQVPFITSDSVNLSILLDSARISKRIASRNSPLSILYEDEEPPRVFFIHSQPLDSVLKPMMHRSDNFFAEQSLLMVSNMLLKHMNNAKVIDTLLKTVFRYLPQRPRWVDGSGLSRYNLFTPQDFVAILQAMQNDFGMERIKNILPTGNEGTLSNYYTGLEGAIFAKTGTLSGVVALSGFLYTRKNRLLIFSVLVNNHQGSAIAVRRAMESFIKSVQKAY